MEISNGSNDPCLEADSEMDVDYFRFVIDNYVASNATSKAKDLAIMTHLWGRAFKLFYHHFAEGGRLTEE